MGQDAGRPRQSRHQTKPEHRMHLKWNEVRVGTVLCDMHDGLHPRLTESFLVAQHEKLRNRGSKYVEDELERQLGYRILYVNKLLVATKIVPPIEIKGAAQIFALYSYDDLFVGRVRLDVWSERVLKDKLGVKPTVEVH